MRSYFFIFLKIWILFGTISSEQQKSPNSTFTVSKHGFFELDGQKILIFAGEIHYFRVARCKWQDRLMKLKEAGLNSVSIPIEWATHEPGPENYRWSENADVFEFIDLAWEIGLFVIVRAGPSIGT